MSSFSVPSAVHLGSGSSHEEAEQKSYTESLDSLGAHYVLDVDDANIRPRILEYHSGAIRVRAPISDDIDNVSVEQLVMLANTVSQDDEKEMHFWSMGVYDNEEGLSDYEVRSEEDSLQDSECNLGAMLIRAPISDEQDDANMFVASAANDMTESAEGRLMRGSQEDLSFISGFIAIRAPISDEVEDEDAFIEEDDEEDDGDDEGDDGDDEGEICDSACDLCVASFNSDAESMPSQESSPGGLVEPVQKFIMEKILPNEWLADQKPEVNMLTNRSDAAFCLDTDNSNYLSFRRVSCCSSTLHDEHVNTKEGANQDGEHRIMDNSHVAAESNAGEGKEGCERNKVAAGAAEHVAIEKDLRLWKNFLCLNAMVCNENSTNISDESVYGENISEGVYEKDKESVKLVDVEHLSAMKDLSFIHVSDLYEVMTDHEKELTLNCADYLKPNSISKNVPSDLITSTSLVGDESVFSFEPVTCDIGSFQALYSTTVVHVPLGSSATDLSQEKVMSPEDGESEREIEKVLVGSPEEHVVNPEDGELEEKLNEARVNAEDVLYVDAGSDADAYSDDDYRNDYDGKSFIGSFDTLAMDADTQLLVGAGLSLPALPDGLGHAMSTLEHNSRGVLQSAGTSASQLHASNVVIDGDDVENDDLREMLQMIRVKFLRLAYRLGQPSQSALVSQVLYHLGLVERLQGDQANGRTPEAFSFERASMLAKEQEAADSNDLDFGCTILVLGKSGVGKSATINSLFDEEKSHTDAYTATTKRVCEISGTVHGIKLKVIDTPGLLGSFLDQCYNYKLMASVKSFIQKSPPDVVLYFDRLDMPTRSYDDLPLLRVITDTFGSAIWFSTIVVLTHASFTPDSDNTGPVSYEMFVTQRSHVFQQTICHAAGDTRLMNPIALVENHVACQRNRAGEKILPNGQIWKPQLLLVCFASKVLVEANSLLNLQDGTPGKPFELHAKVHSIPFWLPSLLQSRAPLKQQMEHMNDYELPYEDTGSDEHEDDYDSLPSFRHLTKNELRLLEKAQWKSYFDELEYWEMLFMNKQWKERLRKLKKLKEMPQPAEEGFEKDTLSAPVPVPMLDMALPSSFESGDPTYRYKYFDASSLWLVQPVLKTHVWDYDIGYDGLDIKKESVIKKCIPISISAQITKDKKECNVQMDCAASVKAGKGKSTVASFEGANIWEALSLYFER